MKLSDFNIRTPVRKKSSLVFNLNNEQQEKLAETKIKSLEDEVVLLKNELLQLRKNLSLNPILLKEDIRLLKNILI